MLGGCGGSSDDSSPLSKAAFSKQGNEICLEAAEQRDEDLKAATADSDGGGGSEEMAEFVDVSVGSVEDMADEISELNPPAARRKAVAAFVADLTREIEQLKSDPGDPVSASSFKAANAAARRAGLTDCAI